MMHSEKRIYSSLPFQHPDTYLSDEYSCDTEIESFEKYMSRVDEPIIDTYHVPSVYAYKGDKLDHTYVPETHRAHIRCIIHFVRGLHYQGKSLVSLEESNIVFHNNKLKLRGLKFVHSLGIKDRTSDYTLLHNLLKSLFDKYNYNHYKLPTSLNDFFSTITECIEFKHVHWPLSDYKLLYHSALLSHETSVEYTKNLFDKASYIHDPNHKASYNTAVREIQRKEIYGTDWTEWFDGSYPEVGPAQDCFKFEPRQKKSEYVGVGPDRVVNGSILRFCRNMATHLHQHIPKHNEGSKFSKKDVDLIIMALFEDELLSFHRLAFQHGISEYFIPQGQHYTPNSTKCGSAEQHYASGTTERGGGGEGRGGGRGGGGGEGEGNAEGWEIQGRTRKHNRRR